MNWQLLVGWIFVVAGFVFGIVYGAEEWKNNHGKWEFYAILFGVSLLLIIIGFVLVGIGHKKAKSSK
jgi:uncharacterized membrane protein